MPTISLDDPINLDSDLLVSGVGEEAVVMDAVNGSYHRLNCLGLEIWRALEKHEALRPAFDELLAEYEVERDRLLADFLAFVEELARSGFLTLEGCTSAGKRE